LLDVAAVAVAVVGNVATDVTADVADVVASVPEKVDHV
jgi:hypothetical protein